MVSVDDLEGRIDTLEGDIHYQGSLIDSLDNRMEETIAELSMLVNYIRWEMKTK